MAERRRVRALPGLWQRAPGRFRHLLADRRGPMDSRSRDSAARRCLFLQQAWRALDFVILACANPLCRELQSGRLGRAGRGCGGLDRRSLRAARAYPGAPHSGSLCGPGRAGGDGAVGVAFSGASTRAGNAGHGCLDVRFDDGERAASAAVILAAAADCFVGQLAWRLRVRPGAGRRIRDRRPVECRAVAAETAGATLGCVRVGCIGGLLLHALRLGIDPRFAQDSRSRSAAAYHQRMGAGGFQSAQPVRTDDPRPDRRGALSRRPAVAAADRADARPAAHGAFAWQESGDTCTAAADRLADAGVTSISLCNRPRRAG